MNRDAQPVALCVGYPTSCDRKTDKTDSELDGQYAVASPISIGLLSDRTTNAGIGRAPRVTARDQYANAPARTSPADQSLPTHWPVGKHVGQCRRTLVHLNASAKLSIITTVATIVPSFSIHSHSLHLVFHTLVQPLLHNFTTPLALLEQLN
jgi:hypothetical protein